MKLTTLFATIFSAALTLCSMTCCADESNAKNHIQSREPSQYLATKYLATNSPAINQLIFVNDLIITSIDSSPTIEPPSKMSGKYHSQYISIEVGVIQSDQLSNWSKYYFQSALTLRQYDKFNLSLMANIEQLNNFHSLYLLNKKYHVSLAENFAENNETELNYSYGLIGSYSVNSTWQFSGGIIHAQALNEPNSNTWYSNSNMALIGTTYSF